MSFMKAKAVTLFLYIISIKPSAWHSGSAQEIFAKNMAASRCYFDYSFDFDFSLSLKISTCPRPTPTSSL